MHTSIKSISSSVSHSIKSKLYKNAPVIDQGNVPHGLVAQEATATRWKGVMLLAFKPFTFKQSIPELAHEAIHTRFELVMHP